MVPLESRWVVVAIHQIELFPAIHTQPPRQITSDIHSVFIGDTLCAWFEITAIDPADERIEIKSWIEDQDGKNVIEGQTIASLLRGLKE